MSNIARQACRSALARARAEIRRGEAQASRTRTLGSAGLTRGAHALLGRWTGSEPGRTQRRCYATPPPQVVQSDLPMETYHEYADVTMDQLLDRLEVILDEIVHPEYEVEYSSGVLTLKLGDKGTYVINKQPPNKQIWLSSPVSGPKRYDYIPEEDSWVYLRDGHQMGELLEHELSSALDRRVNLGLERISDLLD